MLVFLPIVGSGSTGTQLSGVDICNSNVIINSTWKTPTAESIIYFQSLLYCFYSQSTPEGNIWLSSFQPLHCGSLQLCLLTVCGSASAQRVSRELQTWCERKTRHKALRSRGELQIWVMVLCHYDNTALFSHSESDVSNRFSVKITSM